MKITFIEHSCFLIETPDSYLLFDYYGSGLSQLDTNKTLYAFASHSHPDHFSDALFTLAKQFPSRDLILSYDIRADRIPADLRNDTTVVFPNRTYKVKQTSLQTLKSTDLGVAFLVTFEGRRFYHAGDLNCWVWNGAPNADNEQMTVSYLKEIGHLAGQDIFAAFVPLDPRLEDMFDLGLRYFMQITGAKHVFPMHMWGATEYIEAFLKKYPQYEAQIYDILRDGQSFDLDL